MKKIGLMFSALLFAMAAQALPIKMAEADTNKDGVLSKEEWVAAYKAKKPDISSKNTAKWFDKADTDKNGTVCAKEFAAKKAASKKTTPKK